MKYYLYKTIMPRDPKTGEVLGVKYPNLDMYSFVISTALTSALTFWAVWHILHS